MLEVLIAALEQTDADMIKSDFAYFSDVCPAEAEGTGAITVYTPEAAFDDFMQTPFSPRKHMKSTAWDALYHRRMFFDGEKLAIQFPNGKINEDTYIFPELLVRANKIAHIDTSLYFYFVNDKGITHSPVSEREINSCDLWEHVYRIDNSYTKKHGQIIAIHSVKRYLDLLWKIYNSKYRYRYFLRVRRMLLEDKERLIPKVTDPRIRRSLLLIRIYPIYRLAKLFFGKYIY